MRFSGLVFGAFSLGALAACGGGGGGSVVAPETVDSLQITGTGGSHTVNSSNRTNLQVTGSGNTVTIQSDLKNFQLTGSNNLFQFDNGISVEDCQVTGNDNTATHAGTTTMTCQNTGMGNSGF